MRVDLRFTGVGGQGLLFMASAVATAGVRFAGLQANQSSSYGSATRGGYSRGDVVLSDEEIDFPWLIAADVLVGMAQRSFERDLPSLREGGVVLLESTTVKPPADLGVRVYQIPAMEISERTTGGTLGSGAVLLGTLSALIPGLSPEALQQALEARSPQRARANNLAAYAAGREFFATLNTA